MWDVLLDTLSTPEFIGAKCKAELAYDLLADYTRAKGALSEADEIEADRKQVLRRYTEALVEYARSLGRVTVPFPPVVDKTDISSNSKEHRGGSALVTILSAWEQFLSTNLGKLLGPEPSFQVAYNSTGSGPVAERLASAHAARMVVGPWFRRMNRPLRSDHPLLIKVMEAKERIYGVAATPDLGRAVSGAEASDARGHGDGHTEDVHARQ